MDLQAEDTIVALATVRQGAARGIVRLSGPRTLDILGPVFSPASDQSLARLRRPEVISGTLDAGPPLGKVSGQLYVWPTGASYTRQIAAEFHTWGALPLLDGIVQQLCRGGARLARPGEFTLRAFLAGRLDLTQAEAVLGVIDAQDRRQLQTALVQLAGGLAGPLQELRDQLLDLLADVEAGLDFSEEEDIALVDRQELISRLDEAHDQINRLQQRLDGRSLSDEPPLVALYGSPNVGKSTLWNRLTGGAAIVSETWGTTRDYLVGTVMLESGRISLVDTAGFTLPRPDDSLHGLTQSSTENIVAQADLRVLCLDASRPLSEWERESLRVDDAARLVVCNKADRRLPGPLAGMPISAQTGEGLTSLRHRIAERVRTSTSEESPVVQSTAIRCAEDLRAAVDYLAEARSLAQQGPQEEVVAGTLRAVLDQLAGVAGQVYSEELLDRIFGRFCIGK